MVSTLQDYNLLKNYYNLTKKQAIEANVKTFFFSSKQIEEKKRTKSYLKQQQHDEAINHLFLFTFFTSH